ncbi:MAG: DNA polymerase III subunit delta' [Bacteroidota bacterium]
MHFDQIIGQQHLKAHLSQSADRGRIPHAQLFIGPEGCGTLPMALAYAQQIICSAFAVGTKERQNCEAKCGTLTHPDLHFAFPVTNSEKVKRHAVSDHYIKDWRQFVNAQPYGSLFDWYRHIGIEKKQGQIGVDEAQDIVKKLSLKSFEGGYKVLVVWMAEKMNLAAANKLLKLIEEPPSKTVFLLVTEDEAQIINTIKSRCQHLHFPRLSEEDIRTALLAQGLNQSKATQVAWEASGNLNKAFHLVTDTQDTKQFDQWFVHWVRAAFKAKRDKSVVHELLSWSEELSKVGREVQKQFLSYCLSIIRQALLINYSSKNLGQLSVDFEGFNFDKFAVFVHESNIEALVAALEKAIVHIERNGNAKLIFTDLAIKMTRLLHTKAA